MDLSLAVEYPSESVGRACFLTGLGRGTIWEEGLDGVFERPEQVVITDREVAYEGRVVVGERAIRHLAHTFGLIDGWRFDRVVNDNENLRAHLVDLSQELAATRAERDRLTELERPEHVKVFCAIDGTEHASPRGAREHSLVMLGAPAPLEHVVTADPLAIDPELEPEEGTPDAESVGPADLSRRAGLFGALRGSRPHE